MIDDAFLDLRAKVWEEEGLFARDVAGQLVRVEKATQADYDKLVSLLIDGRRITVAKAAPTTDARGAIIRDADGKTIPRFTTIFDAANELRRSGGAAAGPHPIPTLCHQEHMQPVGVCRVCSVEIGREVAGRIEEGRKLAPACVQPVEEGMVVHTADAPDQAARERVRRHVRVLLELLAADHLRPGADSVAPNELRVLAERYDVSGQRYRPRRVQRGRDDSSIVIAVDHEACILCNRCVRACDDVKENLVIGRTGKGYATRIAFDLDDPMGRSSCVSCGECAISCPTDALTFREENLRLFQQRQEGLAGEPVSAAELQANYPLFAGIPYKFLQFNAGSIVRRRVAAGEVLCREGDYGSTAFLLIRGAFTLSVRSPLAHVKNERASGVWGLLGRITSRLVGDQADSAERRGGARLIGGDARAPLSYDQPVATVTPDDLILGEMTCLNQYPRAATITASEAGEVLEIRRNVLDMLQRTETSRRMLDNIYRTRSLESHLRRMAIFQSLSDVQRRQCVDYLRDKVELIRVEPGQVIFRQGERADHFYLVRLGFVKVSQTFMGQERVLRYLGPGNYFGEIGLLSKISEAMQSRAPQGFQGVRTATCAALDDVELVRIRGDHFAALMQAYPELQERMVEYALPLLAENRDEAAALGQPLEAFLEQGLFNAQRLLVLDLEACTRCDECTRACADTHDGVTRLVREGLRFDKYLVASSCRSCLDPYCLVGCPVDAIHREGSLEIIIDDHCIGCGQCAKNCPYGNINMHGFPEWREDPAAPGRKTAVVQQKATTCDLCRSVVRPGEEVSCVYACPHNAAFRMSGRELLEIVSRPPPR